MFDLLDQYQVNELHVRNDDVSGLKAIIAIHNTHFGPALGGCRFIPYEKNFDAMQDAVRLARGMSYKAALAGVNQGGGKAVIIKPKGYFDPKLLFAEFGRFVESLNGRYITAIDSGTTAKEMDIIQQQTSHVTSTSTTDNPSIYTAKGVFEGIKSSVKHKLNKDDLQGLRIAIQGVGNVGAELGRLLHKAGAHIIVADINQANVDTAMRDFASEVVKPEDIYRTPCAVFSPCGLSNVINKNTIEKLRCMIIAGSANVQLESHELGQRLHEKGILYAPDYVINAGGLIYVSSEHQGLEKSVVVEKISHIHETLSDIFQQSKLSNTASSLIADVIARSKLYEAINQAA
ncbi:MAG: leucine dehydrogenase [Pseudohongiellaceae bacterium]|jgi:leucine dehydrogenase